MIVVGASILPPLADDSFDGDAARAGLRGHNLSAPELIDLEVPSSWRPQLMAGHLEARRADLAMTDLLAIPLQRSPHRHLITRCWELRQDLTPYDAAYVALAELLDAVLFTGYKRLSRSPGLLYRVPGHRLIAHEAPVQMRILDRRPHGVAISVKLLVRQ